MTSVPVLPHLINEEEDDAIPITHRQLNIMTGRWGRRLTRRGGSKTRLLRRRYQRRSGTLGCTRRICLDSSVGVVAIEMKGTYTAKERAKSMAGKMDKLRVFDPPSGFCWKSERRRVRVARRLKNCIMTRLWIVGQ